MFNLSCRLGIPVRELEERITYRDLLDYEEFFEQEFEVPSRQDYYLMLIAHGISRLWAKRGKVLKLLDFKLTFKQPTSSSKPTELSKTDVDTVSRVSAARWISCLGVRKKK